MKLEQKVGEIVSEHLQVFVLEHLELLKEEREMREQLAHMSDPRNKNSLMRIFVCFKKEISERELQLENLLIKDFRQLQKWRTCLAFDKQNGMGQGELEWIVVPIHIYKSDAPKITRGFF